MNTMKKLIFKTTAAIVLVFLTVSCFDLTETVYSEIHDNFFNKACNCLCRQGVCKITTLSGRTTPLDIG